MDSFKKSFKSHNSYKINNRKSTSISNEELPILFDHQGEVTIKIDRRGGSDSASYQDDYDDNNKTVVLRDSSYQFWDDSDNNNHVKNEQGSGSFDFMQKQMQQQQRGGGGEDPPSKLIGEFLDMQRSNNGGEISLDMDLEMEELKRVQNHTPTISNNNNNSSFSSPLTQSREIRVSFDPTTVSDESFWRRYDSDNNPHSSDDQSLPSKHDYDGEEEGQEEKVVKCTSNASFNRNQSNLSIRSSRLLTKMKTRSRLQDPHPDEIIEVKTDRVPKSGPIRSGLISKATTGGTGGGDNDDDDPLLFEDDLPEEFRTNHLSLLTLLQWISLILIITALACSLSIHNLKKKSLWQLKLWKWEVMILVLICGRLVSGWGIRLVVFFIERNFLLRKRVLYFVYAVRKPVQNCLWLALVLMSWAFLFDKKVDRETDSVYLRYITKILICLLIGTFLWLLKTLMVKVLASSFHVSTYFDRIQESLFYQYVIETLSGPPLVEIQRNDDDMERTAAEIHKLQNAGAVLPPDLKAAAFAGANRTSGRNIGKSMRQLKSIKLSRTMSSKKVDNGISIDHLHKLNHKNVSAWNMKRLINIVRYGSLSTLDEQIWHGAAASEDDSTKLIKTEYEAKAAARKIFLNVARRGSKYIYFEDLLRFLEEDEAVKTISLFEGAAEHKRISKSSLKNWVPVYFMFIYTDEKNELGRPYLRGKKVNAFRERRALALSLNDTKTAVNKLHKIVNLLVAIVIIVISLLVLEIATSKFLLFASSQLVLVAFVFGNTCKTVFEALIFLFIIHPFDVGDRCEIDGVQMVVEEMNVLTTVFLRFDNLKIIFPNSTLSQKPILNYYRSPDMGDAVEFCVHISTPPEKIALIRQRIVCYIENKKEHWYPAPMLVLKDVEDLNRLRFAIWPCHKMNFHDMGERFERRALLIEEMVKCFRELDVQYRLYPLDINVRSFPSDNFDRMPSTWNTSTVPRQPSFN